MRSTTWGVATVVVVHALVGLPTLATDAAPAYRAVDLGAPPGGAVPVALNNQGQVLLTDLGLAQALEGPASFFWSGSGFIPIGLLPGGRYSQAWGLNDSGHVVGTAETTVTWALPDPITFRAPHAFRWQGGTLIDLDPSTIMLPEGPFRYLPGGSAAFATNNAGQVAGWMETAAPDPAADSGVGLTFHAFRSSGDSINRPGDDLNFALGVDVITQGRLLNNAGRVVGLTIQGEGTLRWAWLDGGVTPIAVPGPPDGMIHGLNDANVVVGEAGERAVVLGAGGPELALPSGPSAAYDINNQGQVVGWYTSGGKRSAFLADREGTFDLTDRLFASRNWSVSEARAINDKGQIVAIGERDGSRSLVLLEPYDLSLTLAASPTTLCGGEAASLVVRLTQPAPQGGVVVTLDSTPDLNDLPASLAFNEGEQEKRLSVKPPATMAPLTYQLSAAANNKKGQALAVGSATLQARAPELAELKLASDEVCSDEPTSGTVTLTCPAPEEGVVVALASQASDPALASVPASVTVPGGQRTVTFAVTPGPYKSLAPDETVKVTASYRTVTHTRELQIEPTLDSLTLSRSVVKAGEIVQATFQLNCPAPAPGRAVIVASSDPNVAYVNQDQPDKATTVIVPAGGTAFTLPIYTRNVTEEGSTTIIVSTATSTEDSELMVRP